MQFNKDLPPFDVMEAALPCMPSTSGRVRASCVARWVRPTLLSSRKISHHAARISPRWLPRASVEKPDWVRELEEHAQYDETVTRLLEGTNGDPDRIQNKMKQEMDSFYSRIMSQRYGGEDAPMQVSFREVDPFNLWVWLELYRPATGSEQEMLQEVVNSWFMLGRLGGYNSSNLQLLYNATGDLTDMDYEVGADGGGGGNLPASMHDMGSLETQDGWARFWIDMGTCDELALDVLINALSTFSREQVGIRHLIFGGANDDWPVPAREDSLPEVTMDPMRGPRGLDDFDD